MKTHVIMCQERFVNAIRAGTKRQTIRPPRKRKISVGDKLSIRRWTGKPYRSKQEIIRETEAVRVEAIRFGFDYMHFESMWFTSVNRDAFARADGFQDFDTMLAWFWKTHGPGEFSGICIYWK